MSATLGAEQARNNSGSEPFYTGWGTLVGFSKAGQGVLVMATLMGLFGVGSYAADHFLFHDRMGVGGFAENTFNTVDDFLKNLNLGVSVGLLAFVVGMLFFYNGMKGKDWPIR